MHIKLENTISLESQIGYNCLPNVLQISFWEFTEKFLTTYLNMSKWIRIFQKLKEVFR